MSKQKQRYSSFLVTINTNVRQTDRTRSSLPYLVSSFERALRGGFGKRENLSKMIKYLVPDGSYDKIQMVDVTYGLELGKERQAVHAHCLVKFTHNTKIHLDPKAIQGFFRETIGRTVYVNIRNVPDDQYVRDYILKGNNKFYK